MKRLLVLLLVAAFGTSRAEAQLALRTVMRPIGQVAGDNFGFALSGAGDLNGDGADDFVIGAPLADPRGPDSGRAYIFLGGSKLDSIPDLTIEGRAAVNHLGKTVAGIGDVNLDGYDDWLVGIPDYDTGFAPRFIGKVWLFFGGAVLDNDYDIELYGQPGVSVFGTTVAGLGDVNGDGVADFSATGVINNVLPDSSAASVFFGGANLDGGADLQLDYPPGWRPMQVVRAGDINGDGWGDILMGLTPSGSPAQTRVRLFLGGPALDGRPDLEIFAPAFGDLFGSAIAGVGDVNGDGYDDFAVGRPAVTVGGQALVGQVFLYFGGPVPNGVADLVLSGLNSGDNFGSSLAGPGDLDGDGRPDLVVGAAKSSVSGNTAGRAFVFLGGAAMDAEADAVIDGPAAFDQFGSVSAPAGNPDGGATPAFLVGAAMNDAGGPNAGRAFLLRIERFDVHSPDAGAQWSANTPARVTWRGAEPADVDLSLDGGATWSTLAAGVGGAAENSVEVTPPDAASGTARIRVRRSGTPGGPGDASLSPGLFHLTRPSPATPAAIGAAASRGGAGTVRLGAAVALGVDWNGDGQPDAIAGDPEAGGGAIWFGSESAGALALAASSSHALEKFGAALADAGDLDGDGWDDLVVGAPSDASRGPDTGRVLVYRGGPASDGVPDLEIRGFRRGELFGATLSGAGDFNGDGHADLLVGAPGGTGSGRAYLFFGGPGLDAVPDVTIESGVAGTFGSCVGTAGDVNGDGFADVLIDGAPLPGSTGAATVHLVFGARVGLGGRVLLAGEGVADRFGAALAPAGDFDGDGFDDFAVGAPLAGGAAIDAGAVYLFHGAPVFTPIPGRVLRGRNANDEFGASLAGGVDLNGDGRADLAIGVPGAESNGGHNGRVEIVFGGDPGRADLTLAGAPDEQFGAVLAARATPGDACFAQLLVGVPLAVTESGGGRAVVAPLARWNLQSPLPGTRWWVGSRHTLHWTGAEPADVWFVGDGVEQRLAAAAGGAADNAVEIQLAAGLPDSGAIELRPADFSVRGRTRATRPITIERAFRLTSFEWAEGATGIALTWASVPEPGAAGIAGYLLERRRGEIPPWLVGGGLLTGNSAVDPGGRMGDVYRLSAVDGLGTTTPLGFLDVPSAPVNLRVWPQPAGEDGHVTIEFAEPMGLVGPARDVEVAVFDVRGRQVVRLAGGKLAENAGVVRLVWTGRDAAGRRVGPGVYFLRMRSEQGGLALTRRIVLLDTPSR